MPSHRDHPLILLTGSAGLIGGRIIEVLGDEYAVAGLDVSEQSFDSELARWFECDLTDDASVTKALREVREWHGATIASVIHLAAYYDFAGEDSPLYHDLTVAGTRRLLQALTQFQTVEQFVFSSSLLVMEPCEPGDKLCESDSMRAEWAYPQSKIEAEKVVREEHGSIPAVVLRIAGVYDEMGHSLPITQNIRRIAEKELESYFYPGDAERGQAFVHLDDLANCFLATVERRGSLGDYEVFLIAEDECLSYESLQDRIGQLVHGIDDWPTIRIPKLMAKAGAWVKDKMASSKEDRPFIKPWMVDLADAHYPVDNSRAGARLGWNPTHRLSATLPVMIENLKRDPTQWYEENGLPIPDDVGSLSQLTKTR